MKNILIVDDNQQNLYMLEVLLKSKNFAVMTAVNGEQALERARRTLPDVIVADILMPVMDGFTLCRVWKQDAGLKTVPFVFYTATYIDAKDEEFALSLGADRFIRKPVQPALFLQQILQVVEDAQKGVTTAQPLLIKDEKESYKLYSERLIQKLEKKMLDLEEEVKARQKIELELRRARKEWEEIFQFIGNPAFLLSPDYKVIHANAAALQALGSDEDALIGRHCYEIFHMSDHPKPDCPIHRLLQTGRVQTIETQIEALGGTFLLTCAPLLDQDGKIAKIIHTAVDITQQKEAEARRRELETQLLHSQKLEALGTLAGGIAHDFNNILSSILGYSELALGDLDAGTEVHDNIRDVHTAGLRAKDLVKQILAFTRQSESNKIPTQISLIVKEALKLLRSSLPATIEVDHDIVAKDDFIMADPTRIHQVLMNLCTNAAQAMEDRGGKLNVALHSVQLDARQVAIDPDLTAGKYLQLIVSDTGSGIAAENLDKIFDPFFTTKAQGVGLGLSVVHGIVREHKGYITVKSNGGETTFTLYLPIIESLAVPEAQNHQKPPHGDESILLIEDEPALMNMASQALKRLGYRVTATTDALEALAWFKARPHHFDLVMSDMTMPKVTGDEVAAQVLQIRPELPVIICTGFSKKATPSELKAQGVRQVIMKPYQIDDMAVVVREILDAKH